jgi:hypothetical protein
MGSLPEPTQPRAGLVAKTFALVAGMFLSGDNQSGQGAGSKRKAWPSSASDGPALVGPRTHLTTVRVEYI